MGTQGNKAVEPPSPRKLLAAFSGGSIVFWILAAALIHAVFIGSLSVGYIRDTWIDPEGARIRKEAIEAADKERKALEDAKRIRQQKAALSNALLQAIAASNAASSNANASASGGTNTTSGATVGIPGVPEGRENSAVVKRINEKASTNEIPQQPDLGISVEETNPKH